MGDGEEDLSPETEGQERWGGWNPGVEGRETRKGGELQMGLRPRWGSSAPQ